MSLASEILARRMRLPRARTRDVICRRDLPATMDDGPVLLADRWVARDSEDHPQPTVLVRSPYGRRQIVGLLFGRLLAERGFQVVIQSVRGTFGSGGSFAPFDERPDGLATLRWLRSQPWHAERIGMIGPSYLGLVQWAVAADAGDDLAALAIGVSASQFHGQTYAGGSLSLETIGSWLAIVSAQESRLGPIAIGRTLRRLSSMIADLPLADLDQRAIGAEVPWFRQGFASPLREGPYWTTRDFSAGVTRVRAPVQFVGGWYDILLPWMLEDFTVLQAAGRHPQLLIDRGRTPLRAWWRPGIAMASPGCAPICWATTVCVAGRPCGCWSPASARGVAGATSRAGLRPPAPSGTCGSVPTDHWSTTRRRGVGRRTTGMTRLIPPRRSEALCC